MSDAKNEAQDEKRLGESIRSMVNRTVQRSINGIDYFFSAAPPTRVCSSEVIYRHGPAQLSHFHPKTDDIYRIPLLLIAPPSNPGYVFDMLPGMSMVEFFLERGFDIYLLEWLPPRPEEKKLGLADYTHVLIKGCLRRVQLHSGVEDVNVLGYCMAGLLSTVYTVCHPDGPVKNLVVLTTPVDFDKVTFLSSVTNRKYFDVDYLVDTIGNVPSEMVLQGFTMVDPVRPHLTRIELWENMWNDEYVKVQRKFSRYLNDTLPLPGEFFREVVKELMWENKFFKQTLEVAGQQVKLSNLKIPLLHVMAQHDNIIPPEASLPLVELAGSADKQNLTLKGGHMSLVAGANARGRLWPQLEEWLAEKSM